MADRWFAVELGGLIAADGAPLYLVPRSTPESAHPSFVDRLACIPDQVISMEYGKLDPLSGVAEAGTVRIRLVDIEEELAGRLAVGVESYLTADYTVGDEYLTVASTSGFPASGFLFVGRLTVAFDWIEDATRFKLSAVQPDFGVIDVDTVKASGITDGGARVGSTPWKFDGAWMRILDADGESLWFGVVDSLVADPNGIGYSLMGYTVERLLSRSRRPEGLRALLLSGRNTKGLPVVPSSGSFAGDVPVWIASGREFLRYDISYWFLGESEIHHLMITPIVSAGWNRLSDLVSAIDEALYLETGGEDYYIRISASGSAEAFSLRFDGRGLTPVHLLKSVTLKLHLEGSSWPELGFEKDYFEVSERPYQAEEDPVPISFILPVGSVKSLILRRHDVELPILQTNLDFEDVPASAIVQFGDELLYYGAIEEDSILGIPCQRLTGCRRGIAETFPTEESYQAGQNAEDIEIQAVDWIGDYPTDPPNGSPDASSLISIRGSLTSGLWRDRGQVVPHLPGTFLDRDQDTPPICGESGGDASTLGDWIAGGVLLEHAFLCSLKSGLELIRFGGYSATIQTQFLAEHGVQKTEGLGTVRNVLSVGSGGTYIDHISERRTGVSQSEAMDFPAWKTSQFGGGILASSKLWLRRHSMGMEIFSGAIEVSPAQSPLIVPGAWISAPLPSGAVVTGMILSASIPLMGSSQYRVSIWKLPLPGAPEFLAYSLPVASTSGMEITADASEADGELFDGKTGISIYAFPNADYSAGRELSGVSAEAVEGGVVFTCAENVEDIDDSWTIDVSSASGFSETFADHETLISLQVE